MDKRVFLGMYEIANYLNNLKLSFDKVGIQSDLYTLAIHPHKYKDRSIMCFLVRSIRYLHSLNTNKNLLIYIIKILKLFLFIKVIPKYDVFIFINGASFFGYLDYIMLKLLKKKIIVIFLGNDVMAPYISSPCIEKYAGDNIELCYKRTKKQKAKIRFIEKYADEILNVIPQSTLCEKKFISFLNIGIPFSGDDYSSININQVFSHVDSKTIKILHAPSNPDVKGTDIIQNIVNELKREGYSIDFRMITKQPFDVVIENLKWCHFVIDEMYSNSPMAGFATEAAYFGKPSITCGYYSKYIEFDIDSSMIPPCIFTSIDDLKNSIKKLINDDAYRIELGKKAKEFVSSEWSIESVGSKFKQIIDGNYPRKWIYDPKKLTYIYGYGIPVCRIKYVVSKMINLYGIKSLNIEDKPILKKEFLKLLSAKEE